MTTRFVDSAGSTRYTKTETDLLGRTVKYTDELGTQTRTLYDQVGRVTERWRKLPAATDKKVLGYAYDSFGRASSWTEFVSAAAGRATTTIYDAYGRAVETDRPTNTNPTRTVATFEANTGRLDTQVSSRSTTTFFSNNLDYSLAGRITQDARVGAGRQYAYDGAGRLTSATDTPSGTLRSYAFDANSNRCANATTCGSPSFVYNAGDELTGSPFGSGYSYDGYGNLDTYVKAGGGTVNLDYDGFDHTVRIDDGITRVDSVLSPDGRVVRRTVSSPPGVTVTEDRWYGYTDGSDSPEWSQATSGGAVTTSLAGLVVTGTTPSYEVSDPKGTVVGTVTQAGVFTATPVPDEYGNVASVPASRLDWLGTQERFVDHPGLDVSRMGVRMYDPRVGRFMSQDPIAGGSANDYDYVSGDPINNLDLAGTWCIGRHCIRGPHINARRWIGERARNAVSLTRRNWRTWSYVGVAGACIVASFGTCAGLVAVGVAARSIATVATHGWNDASRHSIGVDVAFAASSLLLVGAPAHLAKAPIIAKASLAIGDIACGLKCRY